MTKEDLNAERLMGIGKVIDDLRKEHGLSQQKIAEKGGISETSLSKVKAGVRDIRLLTLYATADVLDVSIGEIFYLADEECQRALLHRVWREILTGGIKSEDLEAALLGGKIDKKFLVDFISQLVALLGKC